MIAEIHMPTVMKTVTLGVVVTGQREFALRSRLGLHLMRLGAWVMGCNVDVAIDPPALTRVAREAAGVVSEQGTDA